MVSPGFSGSSAQVPLQQSEFDVHEKPLELQHSLSFDDLREHAPGSPLEKHLSESSDDGHE